MTVSVHPDVVNDYLTLAVVTIGVDHHAVGRETDFDDAVRGGTGRRDDDARGLTILKN